jgi:glutamyl-Q tRNA(Asp) synthetase
VTYVGRFAPSPTGPLHFGSLVTAVASFLHARQAGGEWLVRIEDIDPPREAPGASASILRSLEDFALEWDRSVLYQSTRLTEYEAAAERLVTEGLAFRCRCSRAEIRASNDAAPTRYPGTCRLKNLPARDTAVRALVGADKVAFTDGLQGTVEVDLEATMGDFVIVRRDGLPAYHLAVVIDDAAQGVTTVVRGVDLLDSTPAHLHLQRLLGEPTPAYFHLPVVVNARGQKLSKQTGAAPLGRAVEAVAAASLEALGLEVPADVAGAPPRELWEWASSRWAIGTLAGRQALPMPAGPAGG